LISVFFEIDGPDALWAFFEDWREAGTKGQTATRLPIRFGVDRVELVLHGVGLRDVYAAALPAGPTPAASRMEIHIVDGAECGLHLPRLGWSTSDFSPKRRVPGWSDATRTTYLLRTEQGIAIADWSAQTAYVWLPSRAALPWWERAAPLRWLFDTLAQRLGMTTLHAAAVGSGGRGVIMGGPGGAGKSTLALACLLRGMDFVSDDYCLVGPGIDMACTNLFTTAKLEKGSPLSEPILRALEPRSTDISGGKAILFLDESRIAPRLAIDALVLPRIAARNAIERVSPDEGFRGLAPSTIAQSEAAGAATAARIATLARSVPVFRLDMAGDPGRSVDMIAELVSA
jgi:hypothetical protein